MTNRPELSEWQIKQLMELPCVLIIGSGDYILKNANIGELMSELLYYINSDKKKGNSYRNEPYGKPEFK